MIKKTWFLFLFILSSLSFSNCSILFPGYDKPIPKINSKPLAYFIPDQRDIYNPRKMIRAQGDLNQVVLYVSSVIQTKTGAGTNMLRNVIDETGSGGRRDLLRIISDPVRVDSIGAMKEKFMIGYYLLENPNYIVEPKQLYYTVEARISMRGLDVLIEYELKGSVDWTLYSVSKKGKKKKRSTKEEIEFGIGEYQTAKEEKRVDKKGRDKTVIVVNKVKIKDQPISNGNGEEEFYNLTIDKLSLNNISAQAY